MTDTAESGSVKTLAEIQSTPDGVVKRWLSELELAGQEEAEYRDEGAGLFELYRAGKKKPNSFSILWANTETLAPAVYNATPQPDVRRRYRDEDPIGKAVAQVLERGLAYCIDTQDFDDTVADAVIDMLVVGRGIARIKYEPVFLALPEQTAPAGEGADAQASASPEPEQAAPAERLVEERLPIEYVPWTKFRRGPGKRWNDVQWIAFQHDMTYEMLVEKFGEQIARKIPLTTTTEKPQKSRRERGVNGEVKQMLQTAPVWEIWDRDERKVIFLAESLKSEPCRVDSDPLQLEGFFPVPRPLYAITDTETLVPTPLYRHYEEQARELNNISARIHRIVNALKVRGAYQAALSEVRHILGADDLEMVPIENVSAIAAAGGLDKAIWILPVEKLITVLKGLVESREAIKATIYEITGISDIIRGATNPHETKGAQVLKSQWGSLRLQKMQREVQRFVRDLMRLMAELIAQRFAPETLQQITGLQYPTGEAKQAAIEALRAYGAQTEAYQRLAAQAAQVGAPPMPPPPEPDPQVVQTAQAPSWDEIVQVLRSDGMRTCRVDVETDSTVAETVTRDLSGVMEAVQAIGGVLSAAAPALQSGLLPIDAVRSICLAIARRARLGSAVESAIENIREPAPPGPSPEQQAQQAGTADAVTQVMDMLAQLQEGLQQLAAQSTRPKRLRAGVTPDGGVEGVVEDAA